MKIGFIIPARLASQRLKNKILLDLNGKTVLERVIERAKKVAGIDEIVVSTTSEPESAIITELCLNNRIRYYIGDPKDVFKRIKETSEFFGFDFALTITPDNPLFSVYIANLMVKKILEDPSIDFLKVSPKSVPIGSWLYMLNIKLMKTLTEFKDIIDTEIWGVLIKKEFFNVKELCLENFYEINYRLTLDTIEDYLVIKKIYDEILKNKNFVTLKDALEFLKQHPDIALINSAIKQKEIDNKILEKIENMYRKNQLKFKEIKNRYYGGK